MADARTGLAAALARKRVFLGFVCGVAALWLANPTAPSLILGGGVACLGEALRIWAAGHLRKGQEVTESGPYRIFAHPLYVGSSILGAGFVVASRSVAAAVLVGAYLGATLLAAVRTEEARLRERFGDKYHQYRAGSVTPSARPFSLKQAIANREHRAVAGIVLVWLLLLAKAAYNDAFG